VLGAPRTLGGNTKHGYAKISDSLDLRTLVAASRHGRAQPIHVLMASIASVRSALTVEPGECSVPNHFLGVEGASVSFGRGGARVPVLRDISLSFERGTLALVMGPSGSGKTTLLSMLGCLLSPDEGTVFVDAVAVNKLSEPEKTAIRQKKISLSSRPSALSLTYRGRQRSYGL